MAAKRITIKEDSKGVCDRCHEDEYITLYIATTDGKIMHFCNYCAQYLEQCYLVGDYLWTWKREIFAEYYERGSHFYARRL